MKLKTTTEAKLATPHISEDGLLRIRMERDFETKMALRGQTDEQVVACCRDALLKEQRKKLLERLSNTLSLSPERFLKMKMVQKTNYSNCSRS